MNHRQELIPRGVLTIMAMIGWLSVVLAAPVAIAQDAAPDIAEDATADAVEEAPVSRPAPPGRLVAEDKPNDAGNTIVLSWELSPDDDITLDEARLQGYRLYRANVTDPSLEPEFELVAGVRDLTLQRDEFEDSDRFLIRPSQSFMYRLVAVGIDGTESEPVGLDEPISTTRSWFDPNRSWFLGLMLLISFWITLFIYLAQKGVDLKIRKIAGLEAVDEAVGRATEMGRPILFVPGIQDMNNIQTVAGITILSRIGRTAAEYDARIEVPTSRSLVMTTARETLESSFLSAGRPDAYHEDMSYYVTDEQFGYVAYLTGYMSREKPAACFYLGAFFAESLILAETGNSIGAIQVAGTAEPAQLPFFVAACDYTLIGEEFFAASAYLSGEPEQLGTLKGQDVGKIIGGLLIIVGCLLATAASVTQNPQMEWAVNYLKFSVLGTEEPPEELLDQELIEERLEEQTGTAPEEQAVRWESTEGSGPA
ncbi:MAG: hypothetical protein EA377_00935 [Phycisphaerales bacterium]|nr:MAG: hypothetical protein EA377_00935 [Phycisphaerales bacterium]